MAEVDWEKIRAEYISGKISCRELAQKYNISPNVVSKKATKDGWQNDRRKCGEKVAKKTLSACARAKADAALQGLDLVKYTMDLWTMNLNSLNETIRQTPAYMLTVPTFSSSIAKGLQTTYDLLMKMSGESETDRKLKLEEKRLRIEQEKFRIEKEKFELQKRKLEMELEAAKTGGGGGIDWEIIEDPEPEAGDV